MSIMPCCRVTYNISAITRINSHLVVPPETSVAIDVYAPTLKMPYTIVTLKNTKPRVPESCCISEN